MGLTFTLHEIARHPDVQQRILAEVDAFGRTQQPAYEDLHRFKYIEAVFQEGLRVAPPVNPVFAQVLFPFNMISDSGFGYVQSDWHL